LWLEELDILLESYITWYDNKINELSETTIKKKKPDSKKSDTKKSDTKKLDTKKQDTKKTEFVEEKKNKSTVKKKNN
jgi:hypothetical protein